LVFHLLTTSVRIAIEIFTINGNLIVHKNSFLTLHLSPG
jgi:hypothetical protein